MNIITNDLGGIQLTSVDFRNDPTFLRNQFAKDGTFEMSIIKKTKLDLESIELIGNFPAGIQQNAPGKATSGEEEVSLGQEKEVGIILKQKKCYTLT